MSLLAAFVCAALLFCGSSPVFADFKLEETEGPFFTLLDGKKPVFRYVAAEHLLPGVKEDRRRSSYIHPLYGLDGIPLTDDFPKDHPHHRGVSWVWVKVNFDGVTKDLWTLAGVRQKYLGKRAFNADGNEARLIVSNGWFEDSTGRKIIEETVEFSVRPVSGSDRIIDCKLTFAAVDTPVTIGASKTGYSGFNIRFAPRKDTAITSSMGRVPRDENRTRYRWVDLTARYQDRLDFDGVTVLDHPSNPNFPAGWTLRHYGVLNPSFTSVKGDYTIIPGEPLVLRYRLIVHRDKADIGRINGIFKEFDERY